MHLLERQEQEDKKETITTQVETHIPSSSKTGLVKLYDAYDRSAGLPFCGRDGFGADGGLGMLFCSRSTFFSPCPRYMIDG